MTSVAASGQARFDPTRSIEAGLVGFGVLGAAVPTALVLRASGGRGIVGELRSAVSPHEIAFALSHPGEPWMVGAAQRASADAQRATGQLFGDRAHIDDIGDTFRHTYAAALFASDAGKHGVPESKAMALTVAAGHAHERDGAFNPNLLSSPMDEHNNRVGAALPWQSGARTDDRGVLRQRTLDAIRSGATQVIEDGQLVATSARHLPSGI